MAATLIPSDCKVEGGRRTPLRPQLYADTHTQLETRILVPSGERVTWMQWKPNTPNANAECLRLRFLNGRALNAGRGELTGTEQGGLKMRHRIALCTWALGSMRVM